VPQTTVGYEKLFNWAFNVADEAEFVAQVLAGQPEPPVYFAEMKRINKVGPDMVEHLPAPAHLPGERLAAALAEGMTIVDTRYGDAFMAGFVPGTINIPEGSSFLTWAGWLVPYDRPFALITDASTAAHAARELQLIGLDQLVGYWTPEAVEVWHTRDGELATIERVSPATLRERMASDEVAVLDVRGAAEYEAGHIPGALNVPAGYLRGRLAEVPADVPVVVHCQTGYRSAIALSVLRALGRDNVVDLTGSYQAWAAARYPIERGAAAERELAQV
jgi:hydroxyacylglutathione hydrolase